jgi:hypothetical protein
MSVTVVVVPTLIARLTPGTLAECTSTFRNTIAENGDTISTAVASPEALVFSTLRLASSHLEVILS